MENAQSGTDVIIDKAKIQDILSRGVAAIYNKDELEEILLSGKQLHLKLGTDVTGPMIHLGHAVVQRKIRDFQELGHRVTLIIGDFTTLIGDHSDKVDMREERSIETIKKDEETYKEQFFKTVMPELTEVRHNSEWLANLGCKEIIELAKQFTVAQMIERDNFKQRFEQHKPIGLDEILYPLMQGYDSVVLKNDVEFGGTDQIFNMLAGRQLMEFYGLKPQIAFATKLLTGNDGRKMGKSLKNYIPVTASAEEMYFMLMQIVDEVIIEYFELATRVPLEEIAEIEERMKLGENPMKFKKRLAYEVVAFYHSDDAARRAQEEFERVVQNNELPSDIPTHQVSLGENIVDVMSRVFSLSKTEAKRLIDQSSVKFNGELIQDYTFQIRQAGLLKVGKKNYAHLDIN